MNVCVDQLAMLVAGEGQLYSVSHLAAEERASVLAEEAERYRINHGSAEEIFLMEPDLILAGAFTTQSAVDLLRRLGFRVEVFPPAHSFDEIRASLLRMGALLGQSTRAAKIAAELDRELQMIAARIGHGPHPSVAIYAANSYTYGSGTLPDAIVTAAGLDNVASHAGLSGIAKLPLEQLVLAQPDLIVLSRRWSSAPALANEALRHPALASLAEDAALATVVDARWDCGGPFTIDAVRALVEARAELQASEGGAP
jgi:iron complex transport system substrate-binding protein